MKKIVLLFLLHAVAPLLLLGQAADSSLLTVDRIFKDYEFRTKSFGPARWLQEGTFYTTLEPSEKHRGARDIVRYETASGTRSILLSADKLIPEGSTTPLSIDTYEWSPDGKQLLIFTNTARVWRYNTRGDYWIVDLQSWNLKQLGRRFEPSTLMFAKFAPQGDRVAYVQRHNVYVEDLSSGTIVALTSDGSTTLINGTFDWVYEEEWDCRDGFRWSPDGQWIAYWQLDASRVRNFYMINNTDSLYSFLIPVQYPKVGAALSTCRIGVVGASGGATQWFAVPGDPGKNYLPRMEWASNSTEIIIQQFNRLQNKNEVFLGDRRSDAVTSILIERDSAWIDVVDDLKWFDGGKRFTWVSERDGWRHVYLISRDGKTMNLLTPGEYDVVNILSIDERNGWLYFIASPADPTQRFLYRARLDRPGKPERLTPAHQLGTHTYDVAPGGLWAFHTTSSHGEPPLIELVSLPGHTTTRVLEENKKLKEQLAALARGRVESFRVNNSDGLELDGWRMLPPNFDSTKQYPVLINVYGEPAGQTVANRWGGTGYLWHLMLTQQGYIIASLDNRGTPAPRGRAWRKSVYGKIGILASLDQSAGLREMLKWKFIDSTRVGVWGWSGGGSMTLNLLFRYPDLYHTGISVAPVPDQHLYDATYQERYMGLPETNEQGFIEGSPITYAHQLQGNLLLIHGTGDDNVHYQGSERLINALVKSNKLFSMFAYPNRSHGIYEGEGTTRHLYTMMTQYLLDHLPAGGR